MNSLGKFWQHLPESLRLSIVYFAATRVVFTVLGIASVKLVGHYYDPLHQVVFRYVPKITGFSFLDIWAQWDSGWYLKITKAGYTGFITDDGKIDLAFSPLYPYLIRFLSWPFNYSDRAALVIGLLISSLSFIVAGHFLYKLANQKFGRRVARLTLLMLFLSPAGFIFSALMSEALFLLLLVLAFYWAEKDRWGRVGMIGFLLVLTRPVGPIADTVLFLMYLWKKGFNLPKFWNAQSLWLIGPVLGIVTLFAINYVVLGTPFGFIKAERGWQREFLAPQGPSGGLLTLQGLYLAIFPLTALAVVSFFRRKLGQIYWLLTLALLIPPITTALYGLIRYTVILFPFYIALALFLDKHRSWQIPVIISLTLIQGIHFVWWVVGMPIMQ